MTLARFLRVALLLVAVGGAFLVWRTLQPTPLPSGFASGNGRTEGTEIDIAAKIPGRIREILVNEGDFVDQGQVLVRMDTAVLDAQLREAKAQLERARIGIETAQSQVTQRTAEKDAADAVVAQRESELDAARRRLARTLELAQRGTAAQQTLDDDRARHDGSRAALSAAIAQRAAADAAIGFAQSQVVSARADVEAAQASIERIGADIEDSTLKSPRDGRVQFRIAQPGEVLAAGGRVLNMVDLTDVYMTFFLPTNQAGRTALDAEVRIRLDAVPQLLVPARVSFVANVAQFTPRTVETAEEREKLMFRVRARIAPDLLRRHIEQVKTGLPGVAFVRLDPNAPWPESISGRLLQ